MRLRKHIHDVGASYEWLSYTADEIAPFVDNEDSADLIEQAHTAALEAGDGPVIVETVDHRPPTPGES